LSRTFYIIRNLECKQIFILSKHTLIHSRSNTHAYSLTRIPTFDRAGQVFRLYMFLQCCMWFGTTNNKTRRVQRYYIKKKKNQEGTKLINGLNVFFSSFCYYLKTAHFEKSTEIYNE